MIIGIDTSRAFVSDKTGTENYSYHLVKHLLRLPESRQHTFVLFTRPNSTIPDWTRKKNVQIKLVKYRILWTQLGLALATWQYRLDILWIPAHTLPLLRRWGLQTVVTIHGLEYRWLREYYNHLQRWYLPLSTLYATRAADRLIAVSHFTRQQLIKELHTTPQKIKVVHEGVERIKPLNHYTIQRKENVLRKYQIQDKKYILFVGTVQPRKNLEQLVEAFSHFASGYAGDRSPDYKLVIAGRIGWMVGDILRSPGQWNVSDKVIFTGRVDQATLEYLYQGASLYIQPSITEGFGLPVLEAMMRGVPVISSDGGALREVVGEAGVIVPLARHFAHELARAMKRLVDDPKRQKELIAMGYQRSKEFGWDKAALETLMVLLG